MQQKNVITLEYLDDAQRIADLCNVLYFGEEPWSGPRDLHGLMRMEGDLEPLRDIIPNYTVNIIEIRRYSHWESFQSDLREVFEYLQESGQRFICRRYQLLDGTGCTIGRKGC